MFPIINSSLFLFSVTNWLIRDNIKYKNKYKKKYIIDELDQTVTKHYLEDTFLTLHSHIQISHNQ